MLADKNPKSPWDLKSVPGGMVDLEFIVQVLQIIHAEQKPAVLAQNILAAISKLAENRIIDRPTANQLENACKLYQHLTQILKLGIDGPFDPTKSPPGLTRLINTATASPDIATSETLLEEVQKSVQKIFNQTLNAD